MDLDAARPPAEPRGDDRAARHPEREELPPRHDAELPASQRDGRSDDIPKNLHLVASASRCHTCLVDFELLDSALADRGEPAFRGRQVWEWVARGARSYDEMTNLPAGLREHLAAHVPLSALVFDRDAKSSDGTEKALFRTHDGRPIEAVLMRYRDARRSLCLSSQSGCPLTCTFCATGAMKFGRNLTAAEIVDQALHFRRKTEVDHAVFMGMGEPLINVDNVLAACERLPDIGISARRTAISTVGWIPGIERMLQDDAPKVRLALSVHAADEETRTKLMPVNTRYALPEVLQACLAWSRKRRQAVFVEYLMLEDVNDSEEQAELLADVLQPTEAFKVNLIPYNPTEAAYAGSSRHTIASFKAILESRGLRATTRLTRGRDIDAACGQLAAKAAAPQPDPVAR